MKIGRVTKSLSGVAGEYFVAAELSRRGYLASITLRNTRGIDVLVTNADASKSAGIQVKTNQNSIKKWILNIKAENLFSETLYYVFVDLNGDALPTFHVVPSTIVAEYCRTTHAQWLSTPGRSGQKHNPSDIRNFADPQDRYLNAWHLLGLD
jgi:hypothetical protein